MIPDVYEELREKSPESLALMARTLRKGGSPILAYDLADTGLGLYPGDLRLTQLKALALADCGAPVQAIDLLSPLADQGTDDEETLSIMARAYKDLALMDPDRSHKWFTQAFELYRRAFEKNKGYYSGVNAATLAAVTGQTEKSKTIAAEVKDICLDLLLGQDQNQDHYYILATLAEALLALGQTGEAEEYYALAVAKGRNRHRDIASTRRNMRLLCAVSGTDCRELEKILSVPAVAVFTGHMVDSPDRDRARFPHDEQLLEKAGREIEQALVRQNVGLGYSSLAAGGDLLFQEALYRIGARGFGVLPFNEHDFVKSSVDIVPGADWADRFERMATLLRDKGRLTHASQWPTDSGAGSYEYANRILFGLAKLRAERLDTELTAMALWDGRATDMAGGTAHTVNWWRSLGINVDVIRIETPYMSTPPKDAAPFTRTGAKKEFTAEIKSILFADVVHYTRLAESHIPIFVREFMGMVADMAKSGPERPIDQNAWGDALFFVFNTTAGAGTFALNLADQVNTTDWESYGLPAELSLRIGLHAGPVYGCLHPITNTHTFTGTHVSRAARLEPITPCGHVYASEQFAALAASEGHCDFKCVYVGRQGYAKDFGKFPTYHLSR